MRRLLCSLFGHLWQAVDYREGQVEITGRHCSRCEWGRLTFLIAEPTEDQRLKMLSFLDQFDAKYPGSVGRIKIIAMEQS